MGQFSEDKENILFWIGNTLEGRQTYLFQILKLCTYRGQRTFQVK